MPSYTRSSQGRSKFNNRRPKYGSGRSYQTKNKRNKQYINPAKFIKPARMVEEEVYQSANSFADFDIQPILKENVIAKGYINPSPIQDQAIPIALTGKDIIGIANTGTGKTAAFAIPVLNKLLENRQNKAIVLAPTRELAQQIEDECKSFAKKSGLFGTLLIGGSSMSAQLRDLKNRPNIVIGTPGRIKDHLERGSLVLSDFNIAVLDEVDRMVDMGFINDIRTILGELPKVRQSLFFSATIDHKIKTLVESFLIDPVTISVKQGDTSDNVEQNIVQYSHDSEKLEKLHEILISKEVSKVLVFDETQRRVEKLSTELKTRGFKADAIHGGKTQGSRQRSLNHFRQNNIDILVATDVAARGIDVADVTHVINFTTPNSYEDYVHRIGRAGRAGKTGNALTFVETQSR